MARQRGRLAQFLNRARIIDGHDVVDLLRFRRRYAGHQADCWAPYSEAVERVRSGFVKTDPRRLGANLLASLQELGATLLLGTFVIVACTVSCAIGVLELLGEVLFRPGFWYWVIAGFGALFLWIGAGLFLRVLVLDRGAARRRLRIVGEVLAAMRGYVTAETLIHVGIGFAGREETNPSTRERPVYRTEPAQKRLASPRYFDMHVACALPGRRALLVGYNDGRRQGFLPALDVLLVGEQDGYHQSLAHAELDLAFRGDAAAAEDVNTVVRECLAEHAEPVATAPPSPWPASVARRAFLLEQLSHLLVVLAVGAVAGALWWSHVWEQSSPLLGWMAGSGFGGWLLAHGAEPIATYWATFAFAQVAYLMQERYELTARFFLSASQWGR